MYRILLANSVDIDIFYFLQKMSHHKRREIMSAHRSKLTENSLMVSIIVVASLACSFIAGNPPSVLPTDEVIQPTETPISPPILLSPNSVPMSNGLTLKSAADTESELTNYQVTYLEDQADGFSGTNQGEIDMYFGENHNFSIHAISSQQPLVWTTGWCAQGQEVLNQNLKNIQFEMEVNGQPVDLTKVYRSDNVHSWHTAGNFCVFYRIIVYGWTSETTTLTSKTIINESINDGIKNHPIGELTRTYSITTP